MKPWFFARKFNRFDIAMLTFAMLVGQDFGFCIGAVAFILGAILSVAGERSLASDQSHKGQP